MTLEGLKPATLILDRAAVGTSCRSLNGLAGQGLPKRLIDVVRRARNVFHVVRRAIIDRAIVDDDALWVDDNHLWSCLGVKRMADRARRVEQGCGWSSSHLCHIAVLSVRIHVSLF